MTLFMRGPLFMGWFVCLHFGFGFVFCFLHFEIKMCLSNSDLSFLNGRFFFSS